MAVQSIMGLQASGDEMPKKKLENGQITSIMERYGVERNSKLTMQHLEAKLEDKDNVGDDFKRDFTLHALGSILCPTSANGPSKRYFKCVSMSSVISQFNWAKIVYDCLRDEALSYKRDSKKTYMGGCLIFLQLLFCEYVSKGCLGSAKSKLGPAIQHWTDDDIDKIEEVLRKDYASAEVYICCKDDFVKNRLFTDRDCKGGEEMAVDVRFKMLEDKHQKLECRLNNVIYRVEVVEAKVDQLNNKVTEMLTILKEKEKEKESAGNSLVGGPHIQSPYTTGDGKNKRKNTGDGGKKQNKQNKFTSEKDILR